MRDGTRRARGRGRGCAVRVAAVLATAVAGGTRVGAEPVVAEWKEASSGDWSDGSRWSTDPAYPNNGTPAGVTYDALINAEGAAYTINVPTNIVVDRLVINSPDATVSHAGSTFRALNGLELRRGTWQLKGDITDTVITGAGRMVYPGGANSSLLTNVTLGAPIEVQYGNGPGWLYATGLTLAGGTIDINGGTMASGGIAGNGEILLRGTLRANSPMVLAPGITVRGAVGDIDGSAHGLVNEGLILSEIRFPHDRLTLKGLVTNNGALRTAGGGTLLLDVRQGFTNNGVIDVRADGRLEVLGHNITEASLGTIQRSGGEVHIRGTMDLTGQTFPLDAFGGGWSIGNPGLLHNVQSKITGGTLVPAGGVTALPVVGGVTLDGVTVNADVRITNNSGIVPRSGTTFNGRVTLEGSAGIGFEPDQTIAGAPEFVFQRVADGDYGTMQGANLTIGPDVTIRTGSGDGRIGKATDPLTNRGHASVSDGSYLRVSASELNNQGTLEAVDGGRLVLDLTNFSGRIANSSNTGTIRATSGSTLEFTLGGGTWTNSGTFHVADSTIILGGGFKTDQRPQFTRSDATVVVAAEIDNRGSALPLDAFAGPWSLSNNGRITGGELGLAGDEGALPVVGYAELTDVTNNVGIDVVPGATLVLREDTTNNGHVTADGARVIVYGTPAALGTISLTDSTLEIGTTSFADVSRAANVTSGQLSQVGRIGSRIVVAKGGTVDNTGGTIRVTPGAPLHLAGGTIKNGTIEVADGAVFGTSTDGAEHGAAAAPQTSFLDNVAVSGTLTLDNSALSFRNGSTWTGDRVRINASAATTNRAPALVFANGITWDRPVEVSFHGAAARAFVGSTSGTFTLDSEVTVRNDTGLVQRLTLGDTPAAIVNHGELSIEGVGVTLQGNAITNEGLIEVRGAGGSLVLGRAPTNYAARKLTGGRWHVYDGGTMQLTFGFVDRIETNAAEVVVSGATSTLWNAPFRLLNRNEGSLLILDGHVMNVGALTNVGEVKIGFESVVTTEGKLDSIAGKLDTDGLVIVAGTEGTRADLLHDITEQIRTARNSPAGRWKGSAGITSSAATEDPLTGLAAIANDNGSGSAIVTRLYGRVTPDVSSIIVMYTYNGDANVDGRINADDYFRIDQGFLAQRADPTYRDGDFNYDGTVNADDYFLIDQAFLGQGEPIGGAAALAAVAVPEPTAAGVLLAGGLLMRRRRRVD